MDCVNTGFQVINANKHFIMTHTSAVKKTERLILKTCCPDCLHQIHSYGVFTVCLFCPHWNSGAHSSRHLMLFITFMQAFVSLFSINYFPFIPPSHSVLCPLVSNSHLPQGLINVAEGENHNLFIASKVRKYHVLECVCRVGLL